MRRVTNFVFKIIDQKCPLSRAKKWHFERPDLRTESKNLAKHPPKWLGRHLGHAFPFSGEYQANHVFRAVRSSFYPLKRPKNENGWQTFVYGSIILKKNLVALLTYTHHWLTAISKIKKKVFFGTPYCWPLASCWGLSRTIFSFYVEQCRP